MKKIFYLIVVATLMLTSCVAPRLYYWGSSPDSDGGTSKYEKLSYNQYDKQTPEAICELIVLYENMITHPGGIRKVVPPGICAEYGFLLLQESTVEAFEKYATKKQKRIFQGDDYASLFSEKGQMLLKKEMELYPESVKFIEPLLKRLTGK